MTSNPVLWQVRVAHLPLKRLLMLGWQKPWIRLGHGHISGREPYCEKTKFAIWLNSMIYSVKGHRVVYQWHYQCTCLAPDMQGILVDECLSRVLYEFGNNQKANLLIKFEGLSQDMVPITTGSEFDNTSTKSIFYMGDLVSYETKVVMCLVHSTILWHSSTVDTASRQCCTIQFLSLPSAYACTSLTDHVYVNRLTYGSSSQTLEHIQHWWSRHAPCYQQSWASAGGGLMPAGSMFWWCLTQTNGNLGMKQCAREIEGWKADG